MKRFVLAILLAAFLSGCAAGLGEVRSYARESADFTGYRDLTIRFRDTYDREKPFLCGAADSIGRLNDEKRKKASRDLLEIDRTLRCYMSTLAKLAGEKTFDLSGESASLAGAIAEHPDLGITKKQVSACSGISRVVARWITAPVQQQAVKDMIEEGDGDLQILLAGMADVIRIYRKTSENEKQTVLGLLDTELPYAEASGERLLAAVAGSLEQEKRRQYEQADADYGTALKAISKIAEGHRKLRENLDDISSREIKEAVRGFASDIGSLNKAVKAFR